MSDTSTSLRIIGPKGHVEARAGAPQTLSIEPVSIGVDYSKSNFVRRRSGDARYGQVAGARIEAFRPDVVISGNAPLDAQSRILESARRRDSAFVFWMQDFYSLAIERLLSGRWMGAGQVMMSAFYKRLEGRLLRASDAIVLISDDFADPLRQFGDLREKVAVIPTLGERWGAIPLRPKDNPWAARHGLSNKFVFLYSGTLALKHNPERLWALAGAFQADSDTVVALAGAGVSYDALQARQAEPRSNLMFLPLQPVADFPDLLASADVLVALLESDAGQFSVPSKALSYLCAGRPILLSAPADNLAARIVERAGAGFVAPAEDEAAFLTAARRLRGNAAMRGRFGLAGRAYAEATFDIEVVADRFEAVFAEALRKRSARPRRLAQHPAHDRKD